MEFLQRGRVYAPSHRFGPLPPLRYLGTGFLRAWILLCYVTPGSYASESTLQFIVSTDDGFSIAIIAGAISLVACGFFFRRRPCGSMRCLLVPLIVICVAGLLLHSGIAHSSKTASALGAAFLGISASLPYLLWLDALSRLDPDEVELAVPVGSLIALATIVLISIVPPGLSALTTMLLPFISFAMLDLSYRDTRLSTPQRISENVQQSLRGHLPMLLSTTVALFALNVSCFWARSVSVENIPTYATAEIITVVGALVGIAFSLLFIFFSRRVDSFTLTLWMLPLCVTAVCLGGIGSNLLEACASRSFAEASITAMRVMTYILFIRIAQRQFELGIVGAALSFAAIQLGAFAGDSLVSSFTNTTASPVDKASYALGLTCAVVLCVTPILTLQAIKKPSQSSDQPESSSQPTSRYTAVAQQYGLSMRELDVLELLGAGRSQPYIRDALCLSKSTISTHVGHIYQKCGVHSKQELLDLLESSRDKAGLQE